MTVGGWDLERLAFGLAIWLPSAAWMVFLQLRVHDGGGIPRTLLQAWLLATLVLGPAVVAWLVQRAPASSRGLLFSVAFYGAAVAFALAVMLVIGVLIVRLAIAWELPRYGVVTALVIWHGVATLLLLPAWLTFVAFITVQM